MDDILKVSNLSKNFGGVLASNGVNFTLKKGEIHALIGPNGAGKSTLVKQILGEVRQDSGFIFLDGLEVSKLRTEERIRLGLARTFQITNVISDFSVSENLLLAVIGARRKELRLFAQTFENLKMMDRVHDILKQLGIYDKKDQLASELSHGDRRQLEIALALALDPKVILLDEPMAGLSTDIVTRMVDKFLKIKKKVPILLIEHDMNVVFAIADRISVLVNGTLLACGEPSEIRENKEVRKAYLGIDS